MKIPGKLILVIVVEIIEILNELIRRRNRN